MHTSTVTIKGQVTIPKELRDIFNIQAGKRVVFSLDKKQEGIVIKLLYPFQSFADLPAFGIWKDRKDMRDTNAYLKKLREETWNHNKKRKR